MIINESVLLASPWEEFYRLSFNPRPDDEGVDTVHELNSFEEYRKVEQEIGVKGDCDS